MAEWTAIGLGLGGNLGDPAATIAQAYTALVAGGHVRIDRVSSLYRTPPWGPVPQADFANSCALGATDLSPHALLVEIKRLEVALGRRDGERWGPRAIDIDILFYEGVNVEMPDLVIPHRSLFQRAFVLVPLAEIAPELTIAGARIGEAAAAIDTAGVSHWREHDARR